MTTTKTTTASREWVLTRPGVMKMAGYPIELHYEDGGKVIMRVGRTSYTGVSITGMKDSAAREADKIDAFGLSGGA